MKTLVLCLGILGTTVASASVDLGNTRASSCGELRSTVASYRTASVATVLGRVTVAARRSDLRGCIGPRTTAVAHYVKSADSRYCKIGYRCVRTPKNF